MIKKNYYKVVRVFPEPSSYFYIKNESLSETGLIIFSYSFLKNVHLECSFDKMNWTLLSGNPQLQVPADSYIYFRNTSGTFGTSNGFLSVNYVNVSIGGDIRTILNYTDVDSVTAIPTYGFRHSFQMDGNYKITDISNLSFRGITSIEDHGLDMFVSDYYTGTKGVDLRDVTTIGKGALRYMYADAHNLTEVYAPNVSTWDTMKADCWLENVAPTGVVYKPSTLDIPTNTPSGIPSGWTTQDYPTL